MKSVKRVRRCHSCGCILQDNSPNEQGYISNDILKNEAYNQSILYCDVCFNKMKSLNENQLNNIVNDDILVMLKDAVATDALIVWVVDSYSFNGFLPLVITKKIKNLNVVVVATHFDLLPNGYKAEKLSAYLTDRFKDAGITPTMVSIIGKTENGECEKLFEELKEIRKGHDVYFIGSKFAGKTSLINKFLKTYTNSSKRVVRTVKFPNTNCEILEIPFDRTSFLYELPGFPLTLSVYSKLEKESLKYVIPSKPIKTIQVGLKQGEGFSIGSIGAFLLESGKPTTFKFYCADGTEIKRFKKNGFMSLVRNNVEKKDIRPVSDKFSDFKDFELFDYEMEDNGEFHDISISGLGWICFKAEGQIIRVVTPRGVEIHECKAKIGK